MIFDLIIIGAGPGGYVCATRAANAGLNVAVIERRAGGGTCLQEGCIPTKCLCRTAELLLSQHELAEHGIAATFSAFDITQAQARKGQVVATLTQAVDALLQTPGITLLRGTARFLDAHRVEVTATDAAPQVVEGKNILIATGSEPVRLPIPGASLPSVLTSTEMLALQEVPRRLCIIGGGVIGMEFASIFQAFGSEVTVVEFCKEILPPFDREVAKRLRLSLKKRGISFALGAAATAIEEADGATVVRYEEKGKERAIECDAVLMAVGRRARYAELDVQAAGIETGRRGICVDENFQTSQPGVFAVGDVNGVCQLAHAATAQSLAVLAYILDGTPVGDLGAVPAAVFTAPEAAMVGLTEEQLAERGVAYAVQKRLYRANGKALAMGEQEGLVKVLVDADEHVLGAHILGAHASDLIHEYALLMHDGGTLDTLRRTVHAHPTLSEMLVL